MTEAKRRSQKHKLWSTPYNSRWVRPFRTRLSARLTLMFVVVALVPMAVVTLLSYRLIRNSLVNLALSKVEQEAVLTAKDTETYLEQFSTDVLALSESSPVQGIIRARDNDGLDPVTSETFASWTDRLRRMFVTMARGKEFYQSMRYLDQAGDEIVRVDYRDNIVRVVSDDTRLGLGTRLQSRSDAIFFAEARALRDGQVYVSPLRLYREHAQEKEVKLPHTPIIHFSTPVYDSAKEFRGVVVATVYAARFLDRLSVERGQLYLANQEGFYLVHPDPARTFGFDRDTDYNVAADFRAAYEALIRSGADTYTALDRERAEVVALKKLHFTSQQPERYWLLIRTLPQDIVLGPIKALAALVAALALVVTIIAALPALRLARGFIRPITQLTRVAEQISQADLPQLVDAMGQVAAGESVDHLSLHARPVVVRSEDEIGQLGTAFNRMISSLEEAHPRLLEAQKSLCLALQETEGLLTAARAVLGATSSAEICQNLITHLNQLVRADQMALFLVDHDQRKILFSVGHGNMRDQLELAYEDLLAGISGKVFSTGEPVLSLHADDGVEPEATRERRRRVTPGPLIVVPLVTKDQVIGTITAMNRPDQRPFTQRDIDLLMSLAAQAAVAIENARLYEEAQREIAERVRVEAEREALIAELETKNAELEQFTYTVSHDLKSPLITIRGFLGFVEQASRAGNVEQVQADINRISGATEKMEQLLEELLELSRIGRLVNPPEAVPFGELAREAVSMTGGRLAERSVEVTIVPDLPVVYGDRPRLREVLENLIDNAVKYMGDRPDPRVEIGMRLDRGERVFYVRDNGIGIDPRHHDKVFGLFNKLDPDSEGSGVGLAIVKRVVEVHGGRIWVESQGLEKGSTFCFTLPD